MEMLGNAALLGREKIGYFASGTIAALSVLPTLDWAAEVARRDDVAVVSGFHSQLEREVLGFLLRGRCGIVCALARPIYRHAPACYRHAYDEGRVLFISCSASASTMSSRRLCRQRNEYVASIADRLVFSSLRPESSLFPLSLSSKPVITL